jgi:hypothetical protein
MCFLQNHSLTRLPLGRVGGSSFFFQRSLQSSFQQIGVGVKIKIDRQRQFFVGFLPPQQPTDQLGLATPGVSDQQDRAVVGGARRSKEDQKKIKRRSKEDQKMIKRRSKEDQKKSRNESVSIVPHNVPHRVPRTICTTTQCTARASSPYQFMSTNMSVQ